MRILSVFFAIFAGFMWIKLENKVALAQDATQSGEVRRTVLALYDGAVHGEPRQTMIHKFAEMPLNHLGYQLRYYDVRGKLPVKDLERYAGAITWFGQSLKAAGYFDWASLATQNGLKFAVLGHPGFGNGPEQGAKAERFLRRLGLGRPRNPLQHYVNNTLSSRVKVLNKTMMAFERPLDDILPGFAQLTALDDRLKVHLSVMGRGQKEAVLCVTGPAGGLVQSGFALHYEEGIQKFKWLLNPFAFFNAVFGDGFPVPDVTTLSGRRMYFSHVDGDAWNNISFIEKYQKKKMISAKVMLEELIRPYPDLPVTIGLVTGDFDPKIGGDPKAVGVAREMLAQKQVEVGSHTHTHPFKWKFYEKYTRPKEQPFIDRNIAINRRRMEREGVLKGAGDLLKKQSNRERFRDYIAGSDEMPRAYMRHPFDLGQDIAGSLKLAQSYAPRGKKAKLLQWSGDTTPFAGAIRATRRAGVGNINGGDMRFDLQYPSHVYVPPISRLIGSERQIYATASNENTYTNDWLGPYYGFQMLTQSLENTEKPRRLKPFNLYYHTYSAERPASLRAVKAHLERARHGRYIPVDASHYVEIADSFFKVRFKALGKRSWRVMDRGALQTLRFDDADALAVDWALSEGVIGVNRHQGALYVALDEAVKTPRVSLTEGQEKAQAMAHPMLQEARWRIRDVQATPCKLRFTAQGFGNGEMVWRGIKPGNWTISAHTANTGTIPPRWRGQVTVGPDRRAQFRIKADAITPLTVELACIAKNKTNNKAGEK